MSEFMTRSTPDPLTAALTTQRYLFNQIPDSRNWSSLVTRLHPPYISLIMDPASLPIMLPAQPENVVKDTITQELPYFVVNSSTKLFSSSDMVGREEQLVRHLTSLRPYNPRLASRLNSSKYFNFTMAE